MKPISETQYLALPWIVIGLLVATVIGVTAMSDQSGLPRRDVSVGSVSGVAWSADSTKIAAVRGDGHEVTVLTPGGKTITSFYRSFNAFDPFDTVAFDGDKVVTPPNCPLPYKLSDIWKGFSLWDADTGKLLGTSPGPIPTENSIQSNWARHVAVSPDGLLIAMASGETFTPTYLYSASDLQIKKTFSFPCRDGRVCGATDLAFTPDGKTLVVAAGGGYFEVIDVASGTLLRMFHSFTEGDFPTRTNSISISPDGQYIVAGSQSGMGPNAHDGGPPRIDFVRVFRIADGSVVAAYHKAHPAIRKVAFSRDGETIAIASNDHTLHLWRWREPGDQAQIIPMDSPFMSLAYSPDGKYLASGNGYGLTIFDLTTQQKASNP